MSQYGQGPGGSGGESAGADQNTSSGADDLVIAAMIEELGLGRLDELPLEDRGYSGKFESKSAIKAPRPAPTGAMAAWHNVTFDDLTEETLGMDSIADGQLYRLRRNATQGARGGGEMGRSNRGGRGGGYGDNSRGSPTQHRTIGRGTHNHATTSQPSRRDHFDNDYFNATPSTYFNDARRNNVNSIRADATISRMRMLANPNLAQQSGHPRNQTRVGLSVNDHDPRSNVYTTGRGLASSKDFMDHVTALTTENITKAARLAEDIEPGTRVGSTTFAPNPAPLHFQVVPSHLEKEVSASSPVAVSKTPLVQANSDPSGVATSVDKYIQHNYQSIDGIPWNIHEDEQGRLPAGWKRFKDPKGRIYYSNDVSQTTSWSRPPQSPNTDATPETVPSPNANTSGLGTMRRAIPQISDAKTTSAAPVGPRRLGLGPFTSKTASHLKVPATVNPIFASSTGAQSFNQLAPAPLTATQTNDKKSSELNDALGLINGLKLLIAVKDVKIYKDNIFVGVGSVRFLKTADHLGAIFEIVANSVIQLHDEVYVGDTFILEGVTLTFQAVTDTAKSPVWLVEFKLPFLLQGFKTRYAEYVRRSRVPALQQPSKTSQYFPQPLTSAAYIPPRTDEVEFLVDFSGANVQPQASPVEDRPSDQFLSSVQDLKGLIVEPIPKLLTAQDLEGTITEANIEAGSDETIRYMIATLDSHVRGSALQHILEISGATIVNLNTPKVISAAEKLVEDLFVRTEGYLRMSGQYKIYYVKRAAREVLEMFRQDYELSRRGLWDSENQNVAPITGISTDESSDKDKFFDTLSRIGADDSLPPSLEHVSEANEQSTVTQALQATVNHTVNPTDDTHTCRQNNNAGVEFEPTSESGHSHEHLSIDSSLNGNSRVKSMASKAIPSLENPRQVTLNIFEETDAMYEASKVGITVREYQEDDCAQWGMVLQSTIDSSAQIKSSGPFESPVTAKPAKTSKHRTGLSHDFEALKLEDDGAKSGQHISQMNHTPDHARPILSRGKLNYGVVATTPVSQPGLAASIYASGNSRMLSTHGRQDASGRNQENIPFDTTSSRNASADSRDVGPCDESYGHNNLGGSSESGGRTPKGSYSRAHVSLSSNSRPNQFSSNYR